MANSGYLSKQYGYGTSSWQQQERLKHRRPFVLYITSGDSRVRDDHVVNKYLKANTLVDKETGQQISKLPGIDLGWDTNPGEARLGVDEVTGKWLIKLGTGTRQEIIQALKVSTRIKQRHTLMERIKSS